MDPKETTPQSANIPPHPKTKLSIFIIILILFIGAGGFVLGKYWTDYQNLKTKEQIQNKPNISVTPELTPIPSTTTETADWKTYTNNKYGFEFKYPTELIIEEQSADHTWLGKQIAFYISPVNPTDCRGDCPVINRTEKAIVNSLERTKLEGYVGSIGGATPQSYLSYVYFRNNYYFIFTLYELNKDINGSDNRQIGKITEEKIKLFDQILSTFKFLDTQDETAGWKTYKNDNLGFEFKYPSSFNVDNLSFRSINLKSDINSYIKEAYSCPDNNCPTTNISDLKTEKINKITIYKFNVSGVDPKVYRIISDGNKTIECSLQKMTFPDPKASETAVIIFDQILSTFKFLN
jgi:hypothetical protein